MTVSHNTVAVLRIELEDVEPLIWRRVAVPTSMNLKALHGVIQALMGWLDYHLWEFEADGRKYSLLIRDDPEWNERITDAAKTTLSSLVADGVTHVYDMGDNWQHRVIVEKLMPAESSTRYPQFFGGERRCPPEDCGGEPALNLQLLVNAPFRSRGLLPEALQNFSEPNRILAE
jgi:hypothetical protein